MGFALIVLSAPQNMSSNPEKQVQGEGGKVRGIFPDLTVMGPMENRSEAGIGALIP